MLRAERSSYHYRGCRADQADLKKRMKEIAETRVRYGYRRIHVLLRREGWDVNAKRIYRLYREMGLQLRHKPPKRRVKAKLREGRCAASCSNEVWAMDFVHDQLATGPKLRILTVVDTFSRFSPAVVPRFSFRAPDVVEVLERVCSEVGYPASIRVDQGSEFISRPISLSVRLFANMLAGHIAMKIFAFFVVQLLLAGAWSVLSPLPLFLTIALTALEFLVAALQAYVFATLTAIYLNDALHPGH